MSETHRGLPPGWYRDLDDPDLARYWDGRSLSSETRAVASIPPEPSPAAVEAPSPARPPAGRDASARSVPPAGWYRDRSDPAVVRYWDGSRWTQMTQTIRAASAPRPSHHASTPSGNGLDALLRGEFQGDAASTVHAEDVTSDASESSASERAPLYKQPPFWVVCALALVALVGFILTQVGEHPATPDAGAPSKTDTTVPATTTTVPVTTTTPAIPVAPQPTADVAANALIANWASGNRAVALRVATPQAVSSLFAATYQSGLAVDRGCSNGNPPVTCTFGPPGGANPNDPIYSLSVAQAPDGFWYVSTVQVEG
jgi:hypothetical protein